MKLIAHDCFERVILREVLECASPLALCAAGLAMLKRQRAAAVQDAIAYFLPLTIYRRLFCV